jgi:hypothetical protein
LVTNPVVVNYQENNETYSVVVEDLEFQVVDGFQQDWDLGRNLYGYNAFGSRLGV